LSLDHLGLFTAILDALGISELKDGLNTKICECKLSHSEIIKALIINVWISLSEGCRYFQAISRILRWNAFFIQELFQQILMKMLLQDS
jgi:hypothetical protein